MTLTEAPPRPSTIPGATEVPDQGGLVATGLVATGLVATGPFRPPVPTRTPRPATPPDRTRPGAIGAVSLTVRTAPNPEPVQAVDPRIAARRADAEDEADRVRLRPILALLGVLAAAVVVLAVLWSPLFSVRRISLEGAGVDQRGAILSAANIQNGSPLVTVDVAAARARVAALPMVEGVRVTRVWPQSVVITVAVRSPMASVRVPGAGGLAVVDARGKVIATTFSEDPEFDPQTADLPVVESWATRPLAAGAQVGSADRAAVRVLAALDPDLRSRVQRVTREGRVVRLQVVGTGRFADVAVTLGQANDLAAKALALRSVLSQDTTSGKSISEIDVSVPDAPILTERLEALPL